MKDRMERGKLYLKLPRCVSFKNVVQIYAREKVRWGGL